MKRKATAAQRRDVVTLADLVPKHRVTGGSERRVFGADPLAPAKQNIASKKVTSDLPTRTANVKGGGKNLNDSLSLVEVL